MTVEKKIKGVKYNLLIWPPTYILGMPGLIVLYQAIKNISSWLEILHIILVSLILMFVSNFITIILTFWHKDEDNTPLLKRFLYTFGVFLFPLYLARFKYFIKSFWCVVWEELAFRAVPIYYLNKYTDLPITIVIIIAVLLNTSLHINNFKYTYKEYGIMNLLQYIIDILISFTISSIIFIHFGLLFCILEHFFNNIGSILKRVYFKKKGWEFVINEDLLDYDNWAAFVLA